MNSELGGCPARVVYYRNRPGYARSGFERVSSVEEVFIGTGPGCTLAPGHPGEHSPDDGVHPTKIKRWELPVEADA